MADLDGIIGRVRWKMELSHGNGAFGLFKHLFDRYSQLRHFASPFSIDNTQ